MERDIQDTYLSELSEHLSQNWSKIGTRIGWFDPSIGLKDPGFEDPERIRQAAEESIETGAQVAVELPSGVRGLAIPVFSGGRCLGSLIGLLPGSLAESSPGLLEIFVRHLEHLQERNQREEELTVLSQELSGRYEELSLIYKLGQDLQITDDPGRFLERFSQDLLDLIGARGLMLLVVHRLTGKESCFEVGQLPVSGDSAKSVCRYILGLGQNRHEPIILSDISAHPSLVHVLKTTRMELLAWPLKPSAASQGILVAVGAGRSEEFDSSDAKLLGSIAEHTASFLQNRFLLADIEELLTGFLTSLVSAIDAKDPYTRGHSQRVAYIAQVIAESLGWS